MDNTLRNQNLVWLFLLGTLLTSPFLTFGQSIYLRTAEPLRQSVAPGDSVQTILRELAFTHPDLVTYLSQTGRWCLQRARPGELPDEVLERIQHAFFYDISDACREYGGRYLADWLVLASKAARETFWGTSMLCNLTNNYFGIRRANKEWVCASFGFCATLVKNDPEPAAFVIFPNFEASLWMFVHTMYSPHFLDRLPDVGERVYRAIGYERRYGFPYWKIDRDGSMFTDHLTGNYYSADELLYTWSGHEINNLCVNCDRSSDLRWMEKFLEAASWREKEEVAVPVYQRVYYRPGSEKIVQWNK